MFGSFMLLLVLGFPVAWALAGIGFLFAVIGYLAVEFFGADLWFTWEGTVGVLNNRIYGIVANELMVALPLFIFMGIMMDRSGIAERLLHSMVRLFGGIRGAYAIAVVIVGVLLAASTGIVGASVVLLGMLSIGPMLEARYNKSLAVGTACSVGTMGILIPPSIMLVLIADRLGTPDASVGRLFMGAVLPGVILGALYIIYILIAAYAKKDFAPSMKRTEPFHYNIILDVALAVVPPLLLIVTVLGSIFTGVATTTEAASIGALGGILLALSNGTLNRHVVASALHQTSRTTAFVFAIFIGATIFAAVLRGLGGDDVVSDAITGLPFGETGIILTILFVVFLLGFFLDYVEITLIVLPLVTPVIFDMGVDPVWFAILFAICLQTSFLTPPVGFSLFYIKGVSPPSIKTRDIYIGVAPFLLLQLLTMLMVFVYHPFATWLPGYVYGN